MGVQAMKHAALLREWSERIAECRNGCRSRLVDSRQRVEDREAHALRKNGKREPLPRRWERIRKSTPQASPMTLRTA